MKVITVNSPKHGLKEILVDDEDYDNVNQFKWSIAKTSKHNFYATRNSKYEKGKRRTIHLHRVIMDVSDSSLQIDHRDHNGLNNQKENLRICTLSENCRNKTAYGTSKYLGVYWNKKDKKWIAYIRMTYIGIFEHEWEAALAYDTKAKELFGEFANLNFKPTK